MAKLTTVSPPSQLEAALAQLERFRAYGEAISAERTRLQAERADLNARVPALVLDAAEDEAARPALREARARLAAIEAELAACDDRAATLAADAPDLERLVKSIRHQRALEDVSRLTASREATARRIDEALSALAGLWQNYRADGDDLRDAVATLGVECDAAKYDAITVSDAVKHADQEFAQAIGLRWPTYFCHGSMRDEPRPRGWWDRCRPLVEGCDSGKVRTAVADAIAPSQEAA